MEERALKKLSNRIAVTRYVNLHFDGKEQDSETIAKIVEEVKKRQSKSYCIAFDIVQIPKKESEAIQFLINTINETLSKQQFKHWLHDAISIDSVLEQLNERLEKPALIAFYHFKNPEDEKEKELLQSVRKYIQTKSSLLLGVLIISTHPVGKWNLSPYSDLDQRFVEYFFYI